MGHQVNYHMVCFQLWRVFMVMGLPIAPQSGVPLMGEADSHGYILKRRISVRGFSIFIPHPDSSSCAGRKVLRRHMAKRDIKKGFAKEKNAGAKPTLSY